MRTCTFPGCGIETRYLRYCDGHQKQSRRGEGLRPLAPRLNRLRKIVPHPTDPTASLVPLGGGGWAIIDAADAEEVGKFNWTARKLPNGIYAYRRVHNGPSIDLHRFIAERAGMNMSHEIDHRNLNPSDDRRANLRPATKSQQRCNQRLDARNTSGIKGVHASGGRWIAQLQVDGKNNYLGSFVSKEDAALAVEVARRELHGEFANDGRAVS